MQDHISWLDCFQVARLVAAFILTAGFGIHAYGAHVMESDEAVSSRKWMFWLYSMAFLAASITNFMQLAITLVFGSYDRADFHFLGFSTLLLMLSYVVLLAGARKKISY